MQPSSVTGGIRTAIQKEANRWMPELSRPNFEFEVRNIGKSAPSLASAGGAASTGGSTMRALMRGRNIPPSLRALMRQSKSHSS